MGIDERPCIAVCRRGLLVYDDGTRVPRAAEVEASGLPIRERFEMAGHEGPVSVFDLGEVELVPPPEASFRDLRRLFGTLPAGMAQVLGRAVHLIGWSRTHRHCGHCGTRTVRHEHELALVCPACGRLRYPRLSPAVIVLVTRVDRILLARTKAFPPECFSILAGFVEPGETLEQAVAREVREEVGIELKRVRYAGSQHWPFPDSLMIGFQAEWKAGEVIADGGEIVEAGWYTVATMPPVPPSFSIARDLINEFVREHEGNPSELPEWPE